MSRHDDRSGEPQSPEDGLAEDILRAWDLAEKSPAPTPAPEQVPALTGGEPELAGPERIFAFANRLAQRQPAPQERPEEPEIWISFELAGEIYALPVACVKEIQRISSLTRVPFAPAPVRGITHLRGRVLAVVDLRVRLGLPRAEINPQSRIVVAESRQRSIGLLVDAARQIVKILPSRILPAPADVRTDQSDFLHGVYPREEDLVILLDLERVLWIPGELAAAWSAEGA
jgi:purine-binding chemotaxis protein CheW